MQEYIENAWVSAAAPVILVHAYFFVTNAITEQALENLEKYPSIIRHSSMILRLANDLGTSSVRLTRFIFMTTCIQILFLFSVQYLIRTKYKK